MCQRSNSQPSMTIHPSLLAVGYIASTLHCLIRVLRWYRVSDVCAIGVYSVVFRDLRDRHDPACVRLMRDLARTYDRELRSNRGSVGRLFHPCTFTCSGSQLSEPSFAFGYLVRAGGSCCCQWSLQLGVGHIFTLGGGVGCKRAS